MDLRDAQLSLVQDLLAAPGSDDGWRQFLEHLCGAVDGSAASFIAHRYSDNRASISVTARTDPDALALYQQHWHQHDPWAHSPRAPRLRTGDVVIGDALIARPTFEQTAYYNEFGDRYDIAQCLAGMIEVSGDGLSCVSINRGIGQDRFDDHDRALLSGLMPHVQMALRIHRRLVGAELMAANAMAVLDRLPHGVILVSKTGVVLSTNGAADRILRLRDGLSVERGELRAGTPGATTQLRAALAVASAISSGSSLRPGRRLALPRPSGRRSFSLLLAPMPSGGTRGEGAPGMVAVFVSDPDQTVAIDQEELQRLLQLTPAEAALVRSLVGGLSLEEASVALSVSLETVRTRLKDVFMKTNTHRQADLIRLVLVTFVVER
jgi:DNA-binding CsgD family transcriptional regulator